MVTRHFYELDAVAAQLLYSLQHNDSKTAHAAASELACSDTDVLFKVLCFAWWLQPPDHPLQKARANAFVAQDCNGLFSALLGSPFSIPSVELGIKHVDVSPSVLKTALKKRAWQVLYCGARSKEAQKTLGIHPLFTTAIENTIFKPLEDRILAHGYAALTAYPSIAPAAIPWFRAKNAGLEGRVFAIEEMAYQTWQVKRKPTAELRGDPHKLIPKPNFETMEQEIEFYSTHFPDDIPDEWCEIELLKSHGAPLVFQTRNPWHPAFLDCL